MFRNISNAVASAGTRKKIIFPIRSAFRDLVVNSLCPPEYSSSTRVIEQKTGKAKTLFWNNCLAEIIDYLNDLNYKDENDYLFPGKQEGHFSVHGFYEMLQRMARKTENNKIVAKIGTHSFRKTFGRQLYKKGVNVEIISQLFNHSSERNTRHYLGIEQEDLDKVVQNFKFE